MKIQVVGQNEGQGPDIGIMVGDGSVLKGDYSERQVLAAGSLAQEQGCTIEPGLLIGRKRGQPVIALLNDGQPIGYMLPFPEGGGTEADALFQEADLVMFIVGGLLLILSDNFLFLI